MGSPEGLKALADEFEKADKFGNLIDWDVKIKEDAPVHPKFKGKIGKATLLIPEENSARVDFIDEGFCVEFDMENFDVIQINRKDSV